MTEEEVELLYLMQNDAVEVEDVGTEELSFAQNFLQTQKRSVRKFIDPAIVSPTSVVVESLFSESKYIWNDRRLGTTPEHIEEQMFLKCNHFLWDLEFFTLNVLNNVDGEEEELVEPVVEMEAELLILDAQ